MLAALLAGSIVSWLNKLASPQPAISTLADLVAHIFNEKSIKFVTRNFLTQAM